MVYFVGIEELVLRVMVEDLNVVRVFNLDGFLFDFGGSGVFGFRVCVWVVL